MALILVTLIASVVQSATGFGFALIAVPVYLLILNSAAAVQVVIIISIAMSIPLVIKLKNERPTNFMRWIFLGCLIGFPIGVYMFLKLDLKAIKAVVATFVILISISNAWQMFLSKRGKDLLDVNKLPKPLLSFVGLFSGIFGVAMAMPGPTLMLFLSRTALRKNEVRAVMMAIFVFAYSGATIMQMVFVGIEKQTWINSAIVLPAALLGVYVGHLLSKKINERLFKGIILVILILTGVFMLMNL
ncbi:sulfite exporter TauE/SafE family protein [Pseudemcibacter aquimaris]|uniref:sulfite exporter TauE/SafE family protein n=1 Tax=Pseudemcibacter aquimaris TaxID=2857064 RepID=UPI0020134CB4|nr:sulfite exporter TauE/SafE family protein [Pseudemcibacter aquimaris]MCC3861569.1 sulfite exporter TauE/SafE family protein [Pseudemcibacter aquimaris]WDU58338.1 sulfite exporter TauE/SafE family protein [Pseudemcibacter aquimaris]